MTTNHPAHGPVSLDRLHQIREILSKAAAQSDGGNLGYAMADAVKVIDVAIAAFGAEPVAWQWEYRYKCHVTNDQRRAKIVAEDGEVHVQPLYTAPPAPVVPETLPCPVHLEPGLKFGKGVRTQCVLDALRRRADYYAELEAMTPEQRAEHDAGIAEFKAMLGSAPATHDCQCRTCRPVTMNDMRFVVCQECGNKRCPHANDHKNSCTGSNDPGQDGSAYPAAPQQEVK